MTPKYLTTGQFAKICGTTKDTLFHYDRQGILKPALVSANGYRRYRAEQFFEFDLITFLKEAGTSLEEIRGYVLTHYDAEHLAGILDEKARALAAQQRKIARRLRYLRKISKITKEALTAPYGRVYMEQHEEEKLLAVELDLKAGQELSWDDTAIYFSRHIAGCEKAGLTELFPVGFIIPGQNLRRGIFTESHIFSTLEKPAKEGLTLTKPAGKYAAFLHQGSYDGLIQAMPGYLKTIYDLGLTITGDAYVYALLSYLASGVEENDVSKVAVPVS